MSLGCFERIKTAIDTILVPSVSQPLLPAVVFDEGG